LGSLNDPKICCAVVWPLHMSRFLYKHFFSIIFVPNGRNDFSFWLNFTHILWSLFGSFDVFFFPPNLLHFPCQSHTLSYSVTSAFFASRFSFPLVEVLASVCSAASFPGYSFAGDFFFPPYCFWLLPPLLADRLLGSLVYSFCPVSSGPGTNFFLIFAHAFQVWRLLEGAHKHLSP
jgi:hypothetical protein